AEALVIGQLGRAILQGFGSDATLTGFCLLEHIATWSAVDKRRADAFAVWYPRVGQYCLERINRWQRRKLQQSRAKPRSTAAGGAPGVGRPTARAAAAAGHVLTVGAATRRAVVVAAGTGGDVCARAPPGAAADISQNRLTRT